MRRVFGIGFHKTGTSSLAAALALLGYRVCQGARPIRQALGVTEALDLLRRHELDPILRVAERFDACTDNPWFLLYRELDERFPGSQFILTHRPPAAWLASALRYYGRSETPMRHWIYGVGTPTGHEAVWLARYERHLADVRRHFAGRPDDLLEADWTQGDGWSTLGRFLGRKTPSQPFPHVRPVRSPRP